MRGSKFLFFIKHSYIICNIFLPLLCPGPAAVTDMLTACIQIVLRLGDLTSSKNSLYERQLPPKPCNQISEENCDKPSFVSKTRQSKSDIQ